MRKNQAQIRVWDKTVLIAACVMLAGGSGFFGTLSPRNARAQICVDPVFEPWPTGWTKPCPVFNLPDQTVIRPSESLVIDVAPPAGVTSYVYATVYLYDALWSCAGKIGSWCPLTLQGTAVAGTPYLSGAANLALSATQLATLSVGTHYTAAWDWQWDAGQQCYKGPGSLRCYIPSDPTSAGTYRLQVFQIVDGGGAPLPEVTPMLLQTNKQTYLVGEIPNYTVSFAPADSPIRWSSWLDIGSGFVSTGEVNADYGHRTDANGDWAGSGGAWTSSHIGRWKKRANVSGTTAATYFTVAPNTFSKTVGIYHWSGVAVNGIHGGITKIASLGGRAARISISPRYYADYNLGTGCYPNYSLTKLFQQEVDVRDALSNPSIDVMMITAYDGVTFGDCATKRYLNPGFYTAENTAAIEREYSDFTLALFQAYKDTGKRFILSQWESDNDVYCGAAYSYATDQTFRADCDTNYPAQYNGNASPADSLSGLMHWFRARAQGIADGRTRAAAAGLRGVEVFHAPEFNIVHALKDNGFQSMLYDVLPSERFDFISYSSYESINQADPAASLKADLDLIEGVVGTRNIIVGEAGFSRSIWGEQTAVSRTEAVINSAISWGVPYLFQWNLYDSSGVDFGLYDESGTLTSIGEYYDAKF